MPQKDGFDSFCTSMHIIKHQAPQSDRLTFLPYLFVGWTSMQNYVVIPGHIAHPHPHQLPLLADGHHTGAVFQGLDVHALQPGGVGQGHAQGPLNIQ